ncbi:RNA 3'-terminal phosphate cyclase [Pleionea sediminis]|uniref:RNA 3'-terminal phosphate cyclase n=1 Tax=Pleionea sediminis TaxID=2569479 RepID=UPI001186E740|nr:RNA 3'-terminal phosphate cyclase [Pleionea sediminis]
MNKNKIIIDGSQGEGGGQILRSSLSLSMCLGTPIEVTNIRAGRKKPGLLRQHLTCVRAAQEICNAQVQGDELRSQRIEFIPGKITAGNYRFSIGTAGSTTLVFQTIFPALLMADGASTVTLQGGTHNGSAPSYDFLTHCFLDVLRRLGVDVETALTYVGFYPNGGGEWTCQVSPLTEMEQFNLTQRASLISKMAQTLNSGVPNHVSERELKQVTKKLLWTQDELKSINVKSVSAGNIVSLRLNYESHSELFEEVGQLGVKAERVSGKAINRLKQFENTSAAVGEHLADQLMIPLTLFAGGKYKTHELSLHSKTNIEVINRFLPNSIRTEQDNDEVVIAIKGQQLQATQTKSQSEKTELLV